MLLVNCCKACTWCAAWVKALVQRFWASCEHGGMLSRLPAGAAGVLLGVYRCCQVHAVAQQETLVCTNHHVHGVRYVLFANVKTWLCAVEPVGRRPRSVAQRAALRKAHTMATHTGSIKTFAPEVCVPSASPAKAAVRERSPSSSAVAGSHWYSYLAAAARHIALVSTFACERSTDAYPRILSCKRIL